MVKIDQEKRVLILMVAGLLMILLSSYLLQIQTAGIDFSDIPGEINHVYNTLITYGWMIMIGLLFLIFAFLDSKTLGKIHDLVTVCFGLGGLIGVIGVTPYLVFLYQFFF
jgi:hypothetical protein